VRVAPVAALAAFLALAGCGYVGPVVPPSAQIPVAVTDLSVAERGDQLVIQFTTPAHTTDGAGIKKFSTLDVRIGAAANPFDPAAWAKNAQAIDVPAPAAESGENEARPIAITKTIPVGDWAGKRIAVLVRASARKGEHYSAWSNPAMFEVIEPLPPPEVTIEPTGAGYKLAWKDEGPGVQYRIFRQGASDKNPTELGTTDKSEYTDGSAQWDTPYTYSVVATKGAAESLAWTAAKPVNVPDKFPPSVPKDISGFPSSDGIEVSWQRSPESDLAGYFVYRMVNGGPWEKQDGMVNVPTFSDRKVEHGKTYRYAVSAIDRKGNESEKSTPIEVVFP
jgi:predicted small lipoprotein YifL